MDALSRIRKLIPYSRWEFPGRNLIETSATFCKILGFDSIDQFKKLSSPVNWDDVVHYQMIPFTNRYALEAVVKGVKKFQRPCVFKKKNGRYLSVTLLVEFDDVFSSFKTSILQKHAEFNEDLSGEYIIQEFRSKNACLELDETF